MSSYKFWRVLPWLDLKLHWVFIVFLFFFLKWINACILIWHWQMAKLPTHQNKSSQILILQEWNLVSFEMSMWEWRKSKRIPMAQTPISAYKWVFKVNSTKLGSLICPQPDSHFFKVMPKHIWATEYAHFGCVGNGQTL